MAERAPAWVTISASAVRALPFGRYRAANLLATFASGPFVMRLPADVGGYQFVCDLRDSICREACFTGRYEPQETQIASRLVRPGMTVIDVGANWGYFTLLTAHLTGPSGRILALEPHPVLAAMLAENVRLNHLAQIECHTVAAGRARGILPLVGFDEAGGNWGLSRVARDFASTQLTCHVQQVDDLVVERRLPRVDLIKIDVEGSEADVLAGMADGLRDARYRHVLLECHPIQLAERDSSLAECLGPLRRAGYRGWWIDHSPGMHKRAASTALPLEQMLVPFEEGWSVRSDWPHLLWLAPGEELPR
ncbi:MAG TPA: FkbM family methyltransferase [Vicinamibacterales bacterium]|jgi:FkbM family methyltransferase|nr:FkbM family methyltransferase [Vicinamibacterales bacterium]